MVANIVLLWFSDCRSSLVPREADELPWTSVSSASWQQKEYVRFPASDLTQEVLSFKSLATYLCTGLYL